MHLTLNFWQEILTKKSGAVQNSPPEKTLPEPGPWSPVTFYLISQFILTQFQAFIFITALTKFQAFIYFFVGR